MKESTPEETETVQIVPSWKDLKERLEAKDRRIEELEARVDELEAELARDGDGTADAREDGSSRAEELVAELRRTAS